MYFSGVDDQKMKDIRAYFESIRKDEGLLLDFFNKMPKGGDIHHHALGALWAEDILDFAAGLGLYTDSEGQLFKQEAEGLKAVAAYRNNPIFRNFCIGKWSIAHFNPDITSAHQHFFDIFPKIAPAFIGYESYWIRKIAENAKRERLLYIETLIECPEISQKVWDWALEFPQILNENSKEEDFNSFMQFILEKGLKNAAADAVNLIQEWKTAAEESGIEFRFQLYSVRMLDPRQVLAQLILCYEAASRSENIVAVNLVAPEYHENTLKYYNLQMSACKWLNKLYPEVNLALHAGELISEIVPEQDLTFHIREAVLAGAKRIGHGVDLLFEDHVLILDMMKKENIAIEILPDSNDFILNISGEKHPFESYFKAAVPVIVATDDPGLLRCTLAEQFFILAKNYAFLKYEDFKEIALNSIRHSFLNKDLKNQLENKLVLSFELFENKDYF